MEHGDEGMEEECRKGTIPKGKRMKRYRPPVTPALQLDKSCHQVNDTPSRVVESSYSVAEYFPPPSSSQSHESLWEHTEEEQAVASSLLLLSNCDESSSHVTPINEAPQVQLVETRSKNMSSKIIGPNGSVIYRCNICGRDFRSFQALGGHRASHRKSRPAQPKNDYSSTSTMVETKNECSSKTMVESKEVVNEKKDEEDMLKLSMNSFSTAIGKARVHQCNMCGSEFTSGQALGGHMRRHRNPAMVIDSAFSDAVGQDLDIKEEDEILNENRSSSLALDLNLPAPLEEKRETTPLHSPER